MEEAKLLLCIAFILFVGCEFGYVIYHFIRKKKEQYWILEEEGESCNSFTNEELSFIKKQALRQGSFAIDDITWHDLSMDQVYQKMNICLSSAGDQALYGMLRRPLLDKETIERRKELIALFGKQKELRTQLRGQFYRIHGQCERPIDEFYEYTPNSFRFPIFFIYCILAVHLAGALFLLLRPEQALSTIFFWMFLLLADGILCMNYRRSYSYAILSANHLVRYARAIHALYQMDLDPLLYKRYPLERLAKKLGPLSRTALPDIYQGDGLFLLLAKNIFFGEILSFSRLHQKLNQHQKEIQEAIQVIGELEALLAAEAFLRKQPVHCSATIKEDVKIHAEGMIHPLLQNPIANDLDTNQNILISGSNASGKSTFLKMIALNALFAQCFGYAFAKQYDAPCYVIMTSMSLDDSIQQKESYFMAEVRSIKRMLDQGKKGVPSLCIIDEILRGTNTGERIAAASAILQSFVQPQIFCIGATHDLELTTILSKNYCNMHFSEQLADGEMKFSYQIQKGASNSHNALPLLQTLGFAAHLMEDANQLREHYETSGKWVWQEKEGQQDGTI